MSFLGRCNVEVVLLPGFQGLSSKKVAGFEGGSFQKLFKGYIFCFLGHLVGRCIFELNARETNLMKKRSVTLFLLDINEQKNCQSFQCGFSYLDSLYNALKKRIFKFCRSVQDLPAKQHSQFSPDLVEMGWIGCAVQQANPKPIDRI